MNPAGIFEIGVTEKLNPYEKRRAVVFNYCNTAGFLIALVRWGYLYFFSHNNYASEVFWINSIPLVLCLAMSLCMYWNRYRTAILISFLLFPPALSAMAFFTQDRGLEMYLILYLIFVFFFLHQLRLIVIAACWVIAFFLLTQVNTVDRFTFLNKYRLEKDIALASINYISSLFFIVVTLYMIKFQVWKFEKSIRQKKDELKNLNQLKDKVFSVISHDLRTPIASLITFLQAIETEEFSEEELRQFLPELRGNLEQTSELLNNLLAWARSQMKNIELNAGKISVYELTQETIRFLQKNAMEKNIHLVNEVQPDCFVYADESSTQIVLRNLISNAIKFTGSGGLVKVKSIDAQQQMKIVVEDNGVGIPTEKQEQIFGDNYYTTPGTLKEKGTGLGLLICRDLVQRNGGSLSFESQYMKGSRFIFSLPKLN